MRHFATVKVGLVVACAGMRKDSRTAQKEWQKWAWNAVGLLVVAGFGFWGVVLLTGAVKTSYQKRQEKVQEVAGRQPGEGTTVKAPEGGEGVSKASLSGGAGGAAESAAGHKTEAANLDLSAGQKVYSMVCVACHQPNGQGLPNMFPPLAGSDWVAAPKADRLIRVVLHGLMGPISVNGTPFSSPAAMMPPQGGALNDEQVAQVLTYIRATWGGQTAPVTAAAVAEVRQKESARTAMWTEAELQKIPDR